MTTRTVVRSNKPILSTLIFLTLFFVWVIPIQAQVQIPQNAQLNVMGNGWVCKQGYYRTGNQCAQVQIPQNAQLNVMGNGWVCKQGYKKIAQACSEMTAVEKQQQIQQMQYLLAQSYMRNKEFIADGERFTLHEVSSRCEVYRYGENYGEIECSGSKFRAIERKCEAYFSGRYEKTGEISCSGSELRPIERNCSVLMYSDDYGEIDC